LEPALHQDDVDLNEWSEDDIEVSIQLNFVPKEYLGRLTVSWNHPQEAGNRSLGCLSISYAVRFLCIPLMASRSNTSNTLHESSVDQIKAWMESCLANHDVCGIGYKLNSSQRKFPTGLLQIDNTGNISLKPTESLSPDTKYVTLSHCMYISRSNYASRRTSFVRVLTHHVEQ
jgi:hypothetical protein